MHYRYQQLKYVKILSLKFITILYLLNGNSVKCQFSSLGQMKNYGAGSSANNGGGSVSGGGGGSGSGSTTNNNGGNTSGGSSSNVVGSGEVLGPRSLPIGGQEPTCEELRAMWRFSKRQSRAAEITNEIPTYRDPFTYNVWDPYYPSTRSLGGGYRILPRYRDPNRPIFGRVITKEPIVPARFSSGRNRGGGVADNGIRYYGAETKSVEDPQRRRGQFRFGGGAPNNNGGNSLTTHHGKFQELKELVWTERAKELAQQRKVEEMAARAAVLKEIANGQNYLSRKLPNHYSSSPLMDENRSPDPENLIEGNERFKPSSQTIGQRSIFSGNPSSSSGRNGGVLLPSIVGSSSRGIASDILNDGVVSQTKALPMRPSHFRERNRNVFRQGGISSDSYLRQIRDPGFSSYQSWEKNPIFNSEIIFDDNNNNEQQNIDTNINHNENDNSHDQSASLFKQEQHQLDFQQLLELTKLLQQQKSKISEDFLNNIFYN